MLYNKKIKASKKRKNKRNESADAVTGSYHCDVVVEEECSLSMCFFATVRGFCLLREWVFGILNNIKKGMTSLNVSSIIMTRNLVRKHKLIPNSRIA